MISGDRPLADAFAQEARRRGLDATPVIKFNSMVQRAAGDAGSGAVLADVKAVAAGYPLRSVIRLVIPAGSKASSRPASRLPAKRGRTCASRNGSA